MRKKSVIYSQPISSIIEIALRYYAKNHPERRAEVKKVLEELKGCSST